MKDTIIDYNKREINRIIQLLIIKNVESTYKKIYKANEFAKYIKRMNLRNLYQKADIRK